VKLFETKIYLRFISWFVLVSLLPLLALFVAVYIFSPEQFLSASLELKQAILFAIFVSLALVLILSLIATRRLSKSVTYPVHISVLELSKVVTELFKSVEKLLAISNQNSELSQFLITSSQNQDKGLKEGTKSVDDIVKSLNKIAKKTKASAKRTSDINILATDGQAKSQQALDSLNQVKNLVTDNQKLSQALDNYAQDVKDIANRVATLAETAKFLSLNASIEASKNSFSEDFSSLVSQIRELNITSEQAASAITALADNMQKQIEESRESSVNQWEETNKTIKVTGQNIQFLTQIVSDIAQVSSSMQIIDQETQETREDAGTINTMIKSLNKESRSLVKHVDDISRIINEQMVITRALNRSSESLTSVTKTLDDLVGKNND